MKKSISIIAILLLAATFVFNFTACGKYKGFKQDKESGIYYKFHILNKDSVKAELGDMLFLDYQLSMKTADGKDSILVPQFPIQEIVRESVYNGDVYAALGMLHVGDSATFILNADTFFYYMGGENPFETNDLYFTFKLNKLVPAAEVEEMMRQEQAAYEAKMEEFKAAEEPALNNYLAENKITVKPTASGLYYIQTKAGNGAKAENGKFVKVHYTGKLLDGTVFDSSIERGEPISFPLGQGQVIPGWEEGIAMMKEGGKATLIIPSSLAYGANGAGAVIPPYSSLVFDVELIEVTDAPSAPVVAQ